MRFLLLILFVSSVLTDEQVAKNADKKIEDKKEAKKSIEEPKSKTGKRDSSDHISSFGINPNDQPFKPMLNSPAPFVAAASSTQQVFYDKNQVPAGAAAGNAKGVTNAQTANAYRAQYSQVAAHQQQQQRQQQPNKNLVRVVGKNEGIQQHQTQPSILYAAPQNPAYNYERIPQQQQQQIQLQQPLPVPRSQLQQQKQIQYVIAIPLSHLRQLQQQLVPQQQQEQPSHLQGYKGQQQQQQQLQAVPVYSIAGALARDHYGGYRPFHRFAPSAVNDVSAGSTQQQTGPSQQVSPATQYVQIPASVLLAAMQSTQLQQQQQQHQPQQQQQQQRPVFVTQPLYQQQQQPQPQLQLQLQHPIQQQQQQPTQLYYYQPQQQQQPVQFTQSQPAHTLTPSPIYAYHVNPLQQQQQQPQQQQQSQQHQTFEHLTEPQQVNVGKQLHRVRGVRPTANLTPSQQYDTTAEAYESEEKAQFVTLQAPPAHTNLNAHFHTNAHNQQFIAQAPIAHQHQQQVAPSPPAPVHRVVQAPAPANYENLVHYYPQYVQHYQEQPQHQQQQQRQSHPQLHRLQLQQPHQHSSFVEHLNNLPFSQGIHGPTPLPFLRLPPAAGDSSLYNLNVGTAPTIPQPFIAGGFQPSFNQLGMPNKVASFTNVLLQPFVGHPSSFSTPEIGTALASSSGSIPFLHATGGIRYGSHLYHPPTSAVTLVADNKQHHHTAAHHTDPRVLTTTAAEAKASSLSSAKAAVAGNPTIVKYP